MEECSTKQSTAYYITNCDTEIATNSLDKVTTLLSNASLEIKDRHPVILSSKRHLASQTNIQGYPQYFVSLCRTHNLLKNDRVTLLSPMDQLIAVQLCLAEKNKQETGDFDVETSVVLQAVKDITNKKLLSNYDVTSCTKDSGICTLYQTFLDDCNYMDSCDIFLALKQECENNEELRRQISETNFMILDSPKSLLERHMLEYLCNDKILKCVTVEVPLEVEEDLTVDICDGSIDMFHTDVPLSTVKKPSSITEAYVRLVFLSYLDLIVNSRSELALARVFNVPERELTHEAFTGLKHCARDKNMTMYQTASSYIMRIRLGGKGYAPDPNNPLAPYVKGVGEFVSLMHRMETVIEEDPDSRSACKRTVNIIKREMLKCKDSRIRNTSVEAVSDHLQLQIVNIIDILDKQIIDTPDKAPANGGSLTSRRTRKILRQLLDKLATMDEEMTTLDHLTDIYSSQRTPLRFPSVMSHFRSPEEELEVTSPDNRFNMSLSQRVMDVTNKQQTPVYAKRYKANYDWAEPVHAVDMQKDDDIFSSSQIYVIPSKTIVHGGTKFSNGQAAKLLETMLEKENINENDSVTLTRITNNENTEKETSQPEKKKPANKKNNEAKSKKRPLAEESASSQPTKKKKPDQTKSCRRKLLPPVKGQQSVAKFFRV
ncbi:hypothetical protein ACF0H5_014663 [Mactra antiquata]